MCLNCGCGQPNERHGSDANITLDDVRRAGEANDQDLATSVGHMRSALASLSGVAGANRGRPVEERVDEPDRRPTPA